MGPEGVYLLMLVGDTSYPSRVVEGWVERCQMFYILPFWALVLPAENQRCRKASSYFLDKNDDLCGVVTFICLRNTFFHSIVTMYALFSLGKAKGEGRELDVRRKYHSKRGPDSLQVSGHRCGLWSEEPQRKERSGATREKAK